MPQAMVTPPIPLMPPALGQQTQSPAARPMASAPPPVPQPGDVVNFHRYMGGNPADDTSWQPLAGDDYLKAIPTTRANLVRAIVTGRAPLPNGRASKPDAFSNQLLQDVAMAEPGFDGTTWKVRQQARLDFTSGKTAAIIRALNQAPLHAVELSNAFDDLHNTRFGSINNFLTNLQAGTGNTQQQAARGAFNENQPALAGELATTYKGGYATEPDIAAQTKAFDMGLPPAESHAALAKASSLMGDRLTQLNEQWHNAMGPLAEPFPVMGPKAAAALKYLQQKYVDGQKAAGAQHEAPQPAKASKGGFVNGQAYTDKHGNTATYLNGKWVQH